MNSAKENKLNRDEVIKRVCEFLNFESPKLSSEGVVETIKELCVARLCQIVGITGRYNYKSNFFEFFSSIVGEAVCEKLSIKLHIAGDELRLVKYEGINLVKEVKSYLDNECIEEAFLDAFNLIDKFKNII